MRRIALALVVLLLLAACVSSRPTPSRPVTGLPSGVGLPPNHLIGNPLPLGVEVGQDPVCDGATLIVRICGLYDTAGAVGLALYDSPEGFADDCSIRLVYVQPKNGGVVYEFRGLERGTYAVKAWQDWTCNARLDTGFMGKPREPYGYSGNARYKNATPPWGAVSVDVDCIVTDTTFRMWPPR